MDQGRHTTTLKRAREEECWIERRGTFDELTAFDSPRGAELIRSKWTERRPLKCLELSPVWCFRASLRPFTCSHFGASPPNDSKDSRCHPSRAPGLGLQLPPADEAAGKLQAPSTTTSASPLRLALRSPRQRILHLDDTLCHHLIPSWIGNRNFMQRATCIRASPLVFAIYNMVEVSSPRVWGLY
jgi:hypothetical protein